MKATTLLHNLGQSIWLDNITRDMLDSGMLKRYIDELSVTPTSDLGVDSGGVSDWRADALRGARRHQRRIYDSE